VHPEQAGIGRMSALRRRLHCGDGHDDPTTRLCPPLVVTGEERSRLAAISVETITARGGRLGSIGNSRPSA